MTKEAIDTQYAAPLPAPEGSLLEFLEQMPSDPHANEPINPIGVAEAAIEWNKGLEEELAQADADEMHRQAAATESRSKAQQGKHSALQGNGFYATGANLRTGTFLPGFGPVTNSNHTKADAYARELNRTIHRKQGEL